VKLRDPRTALALVVLAVLAGSVACGKYGEPMRSRSAAPAARSAPPTLTPANGASSDEECPPEQQPKSEAKAERR
jgi:hypothetical protein